MQEITNVTSYKQEGGITSKNVNAKNISSGNRKFVWTLRAQGFIAGIILNIVSSYIYSFLTN